MAMVSGLISEIADVSDMWGDDTPALGEMSRIMSPDNKTVLGIVVSSTHCVVYIAHCAKYVYKESVNFLLKSMKIRKNLTPEVDFLIESIWL